MSAPVIHNFNELKKDLFLKDCRFSERSGKFCFDDANFDGFANRNPTPIYVHSKQEIGRYIQEIQEAFSSHPHTEIFYAAKVCSDTAILRIVKDLGLGVGSFTWSNFIALDNTSRPLTSGDHETPLRRQSKEKLASVPRSPAGNTSA